MPECWQRLDAHQVTVYSAHGKQITFRFFPSPTKWLCPHGPSPPPCGPARIAGGISGVV